MKCVGCAGKGSHLASNSPEIVRPRRNPLRVVNVLHVAVGFSPVDEIPQAEQDEVEDSVEDEGRLDHSPHALEMGEEAVVSAAAASETSKEAKRRVSIEWFLMLVASLLAYLRLLWC